MNIPNHIANLIWDAVLYHRVRLRIFSVTEQNIEIPVSKNTSTDTCNPMSFLGMIE